MSETLILGLGNPILKDDAVGILVAQEVEKRLQGRPDVVIRIASVGGLELLELMAGFRCVIIIDAIKTGAKPGTIHRLLPEAHPTTDRIAAVHEINLSTALKLGKMMGMEMPDKVVIYAIEVQDDRSFGEEVSQTVSEAIGFTAACVACELLGLGSHR